MRAPPVESWPSKGTLPCRRSRSTASAALANWPSNGISAASPGVRRSASKRTSKNGLPLRLAPRHFALRHFALRHFAMPVANGSPSFFLSLLFGDHRLGSFSQHDRVVRQRVCSRFRKTATSGDDFLSGNQDDAIARGGDHGSSPAANHERSPRKVQKTRDKKRTPASRSEEARANRPGHHAGNRSSRKRGSENQGRAPSKRETSISFASIGKARSANNSGENADGGGANLLSDWGEECPEVQINGTCGRQHPGWQGEWKTARTASFARSMSMYKCILFCPAGQDTPNDFLIANPLVRFST